MVWYAKWIELSSLLTTSLPPLREKTNRYTFPVPSSSSPQWIFVLSLAKVINTNLLLLLICTLNILLLLLFFKLNLTLFKNMYIYIYTFLQQRQKFPSWLWVLKDCGLFFCFLHFHWGCKTKIQLHGGLAVLQETQQEGNL